MVCFCVASPDLLPWNTSTLSLVPDGKVNGSHCRYAQRPDTWETQRMFSLWFILPFQFYVSLWNLSFKLSSLGYFYFILQVWIWHFTSFGFLCFRVANLNFFRALKHFTRVTLQFYFARFQSTSFVIWTIFWETYSVSDNDVSLCSLPWPTSLWHKHPVSDGKQKGSIFVEKYWNYAWQNV